MDVFDHSRTLGFEPSARTLAFIKGTYTRFNLHAGHVCSLRYATIGRTTTLIVARISIVNPIDNGMVFPKGPWTYIIYSTAEIRRIYTRPNDHIHEYVIENTLFSTSKPILTHQHPLLNCSVLSTHSHPSWDFQRRTLIADVFGKYHARYSIFQALPSMNISCLRWVKRMNDVCELVSARWEV